MSELPDGKDKSMKTAFIRVSALNIVNAQSEFHNFQIGEEVKYSSEKIENILEHWARTRKFKYYFIAHEPEMDDAIPHFHIVLNFQRSAAKFSVIKRKFPFGHITTCGSVTRCIQYLVHYNHPSKKQYEWKEIIHNDENGLEKFYGKSKTKSFDELLRKISNGEIREYQIPDHIDGVTYAKKRRQIENAVIYHINKQVQNPERDWSNRIRTIVIQGEPRTGKTSLAKEYCNFLNKSFFISGSGKDPWQFYQGQDCVILDDLRDDTFPISVLIKMLDPYNSTPIQRRYYNACFFGNIIIITTNQKIWNFYEYDISADYESIKAFLSRIELIIDMEERNDESIFRLITYNRKEEWFERSTKTYQYTSVRNFDDDALSRMAFYQQCQPMFSDIRLLIGLMHEDNIADPVNLKLNRVTDPETGAQRYTADLSRLKREIEVVRRSDIKLGRWYKPDSDYSTQQIQTILAHNTAQAERRRAQLEKASHEEYRERRMQESREDLENEIRRIVDYSTFPSEEEADRYIKFIVMQYEDKRVF